MADRSISCELDDETRRGLALIADDGPWRSHGHHVFAPDHGPVTLHLDEVRADVVANLPRVHRTLLALEADRVLAFEAIGRLVDLLREHGCTALDDVESQPGDVWALVRRAVAAQEVARRD